MNILGFYKWATTLIWPLLRLFLSRRKLTGKEHPTRYKERRGYASIKRPKNKLIWIHAASVGEAMSSLALIEALLNLDKDLYILLTTGTVTSAAVMANKLPKTRVVHQFIPVDRPKWVRRFIKYWQPDLSIWLESELWPNLIAETLKVGSPLLLINGRMSESSFNKWKRLPSVAAKLLGSFDLCLGQSIKDSARLKALGANNILSLGNLKLAAKPLDYNKTQFIKFKKYISIRDIYVAASTHPGEERIIAEAHLLLRQKYPNFLTIIAPRHPDRGDVIEADIISHGLKIQRRSVLGFEMPDDDCDIYLVDSLGELGLFYRLSDIVFLGGTLATDVGGHNPVEPAQLDCAIIRGSDMSNFTNFAAALDKLDGSIVINDAKTLASELDRLFSDNKLLARQIAASNKFADQGNAVLDDVIKAIKPFLPLSSKDKNIKD